MQSRDATLKTVGWGVADAPHTALLDPAHRCLEVAYPSREAYLEYLKSQPVFGDRWD